MNLRRGTRGLAAVTALGTAAAALALTSASPGAQAATPQGGQVIANGGFEGGLWTANETGEVSVVADPVDSTNRVIRATGRATTGSGPGIELGGRMSAGTTYTLSWRVFYDGADAPATKSFNATARYASAQKDEYGPYNLHVNLVQAAGVAKGAWRTVTGEFTIPADRTDVSRFRLFFETPWTASPSPTADLFDFMVDDVVLTEKGTTRNLVSGGTFDDQAVAPWTTRGAASGIAATTTDKASGSSSLLVSGRTDSTSGAAQSVPVEPGATYDASFKVKYADAAAAGSVPFALTADYGSATGGAQYVVLGSKAVTKDAWTTVTASFTVPQRDVRSLQLFVENGSQIAGFPTSFWLDDVSVTKTGGSTTPPPAPTYTDDLERTANTATDFGAFAKTPGRGNPLVTQNFGADPWAMEYDGRLYVYTTNDTQEWADYLDKGQSNDYGRINQINVWSSADLVNWTNHGGIDAAGPSGLAKTANNSWAPAAVHRTVDGKEKFYLYFANSGGGIYVLTADSPVGPWTSPLPGALVSFSTPGVRGNTNPEARDVIWLFDPAVLIDDDGEGYLYFGGGTPNDDPDTPVNEQNDPGTGRVIKLGDDLISVEGEAQLVDAPSLFEDSGIHKVGDTYYYSYCSNFGNDDPRTGNGVINYMKSDSPMGPWTEDTYVGRAFNSQASFFPNTGGNNHHAVFQFGGEWFITYHAATLDVAADGSNKGFRNAQIDRIGIAADGTLTPAKGTWEGPGQRGTLDPYAGPVSAETIAWQAGTRQGFDGSSSFATSVPSSILTSVDDGDWTSLSQVDFGAAGASRVTADVRSKAGGTITVRTSSKRSDDDVVAVIDVPAATGTTTDAATWTPLSADLPAGALSGVEDVWFTFASADGSTPGEDLFDVRSWTFTSARPTPGTEPGTPGTATPTVPTVPTTPAPPVVATGPSVKVKAKGAVRVGQRVRLVITSDSGASEGRVRIAGRTYRFTLRDGRAVVRVAFPRAGKVKVVVRIGGDKTVERVRVKRR
ncbi:carbohydrate binding domain-containing protein [Nocardioides flavescens]|uniref:Family 43 glycosylhydrolase n=1 Tax=Nocardioides flavescens TaxID=2691959 RepID=A0A6L7ETR2_9ACTN|nr:carbohydrate binding domain-containing protein [Nocardioides flavescens]MXG89026.1 family 43 glycosylhydrolase [Nocardioides flavescens]